MTWLAGETITAARLSQDSNGTTLTQDTAASLNTWEDWGTETVTFPDPGVAVKVKAWLTGRVFNTGDASTTCQHRVAISFDGGSTFDTSQEPTLNVGTGAGNQQRTTLANEHHKAGTPTGQIVVKAQLKTDDVSNTFSSGFLMAEVVPQ